MKKLMIACAAALAAFAAAQAADVTSANIVGTQTITLKGTTAKAGGGTLSGYTMIAINWDAIGTNTLDLQTLFSATDIAKMDSRAPGKKDIADRIMIWNGSNDSYANYYLKKANGVVVGWADINTDAVPASILLSKGDAFWYFRQAASDIEVSIVGEVSSDASVSFDIVGANGVSGYTMIGAGFPVDLMLNETQFGWAVGDSRAPGKKDIADRIMVWDATSDTYANYYLKKANGVVVGWADINTDVVDANAKIPAGAAAWYFRQNTTDIVITEASPLN